jgi:hypothetical protein
MFDIAQGTRREVAPIPRARSDFASCVVGSAIYLFGGSDEDEERQDSVFKYDTVANEWSILAPMPNLSLDSMSLNASNVGDLIYIVGAGRDYNQVLRFDPASGVWSIIAPTLSKRLFCSSFALLGSLYVAGGTSGPGSSVERYDAATDTWAAVTHMLEGRYGFQTVTVTSANLSEEQDFFDALIAKSRP